MKHSVLILLLVASTVVASAQTPAKPAAPAAKPASAATKPAAVAAMPAAPAVKAVPVTPPTVAAIIKAPADIPQHPGIQKPIFTVALRYQEIEIGKGAVAEPDRRSTTSELQSLRHLVC